MPIPKFYPGGGPGRRRTPRIRLGSPTSGTAIQSNVTGGVTIVALYGPWAYPPSPLSDDGNLPQQVVSFQGFEDAVLGTAMVWSVYRAGFAEDSDLPQSVASFQGIEDGLLGTATLVVSYRAGFSEDSDIPQSVASFQGIEDGRQCGLKVVCLGDDAQRLEDPIVDCQIPDVDKRSSRFADGRRRGK